jgi:CDP-paratose 2-epimerase
MIFISTSRIYPISRINEIAYTEQSTRFEIDENPGVFGCTKHGITEHFPVNGPRSLYGATKLASELMIEEYREFLQVPAIINRCGVITGPYQMGKVDQGVIVLWLAKHYFNKSLAYFGFNGTGKQVRDILHIDDLFTLIYDQLTNYKMIWLESLGRVGFLADFVVAEQTSLQNIQKTIDDYDEMFEQLKKMTNSDRYFTITNTIKYLCDFESLLLKLSIPNGG